MWNRFQVQRPLSIFLGKRSVTGNDFREDGWQDTRMRKPGALGVVGASHAHSPGAPAAGGRGRRGGEETLEGGPPLPPANLGTSELQASPPSRSTPALGFVLFLWARLPLGLRLRELK